MRRDPTWKVRSKEVSCLSIEYKRAIEESPRQKERSELQPQRDQTIVEGSYAIYSLTECFLIGFLTVNKELAY